MNNEQISENTEHRAGRLHDGLCADDERRCGEYRHGSRMREGHLRQSGVDGAAAIQHSDGTVEQVPEFSALYPGWTVPKQAASVSSTALAEVADVGSHSISGYYRNVYLTQDVKYKPFYSFMGNGETVSAFAVTIPGSKYNLGIYNETAQQDAGWLPNLSKGDRVLLQTANGVYYSIRASVPLNMPIGYSRMKVEETGGN